MVKVSVEVQYNRARFVVGLQAQSMRRALSIVAARYPGSVARVKLPIEPEGFLVEGAPLERDRSRLLGTGRSH